MKKLPTEFLSGLKDLNHDAFRRLPEIIESTQPTVSVRVNPSFPVDGFAGVATRRVPWNADGLYLGSRPDFTHDARMHQGRYYVQDASSMAVRAAAEYIRENLTADRPLCFFDACAAPGGKTTAVLDALASDTFAVANEFESKRVHILAENLAKWGAEAVITNYDAAQIPLPEDFFDVILADVPCSGEGMMRKNDMAINQWTPRLVEQCSSLQRKIIDNIWHALRPGGFLIYSTCTFNTFENEMIVQHAIDDLGVQPVDIGLYSPGIIGAVAPYDFPAYRFVPGSIEGEGLFMAVLRKKGDSGARFLQKRVKLNVKAPIPLSDFLEGDYTVVSQSPLQAIRTIHLPLFAFLTEKIRPFSAGVELGTFKGKDFIPSQHLALSRNLKRCKFPEVEVDHETSIRYLRREALVLPPRTPRGIVLLTFEGYPLGWVKNVGNRANNLYPEAWKIRT